MFKILLGRGQILSVRYWQAFAIVALAGKSPAFFCQTSIMRNMSARYLTLPPSCTHSKYYAKDIKKEVFCYHGNRYSVREESWNRRFHGLPMTLVTGGRVCERVAVPLSDWCYLSNMVRSGSLCETNQAGRGF